MNVVRCNDCGWIGREEDLKWFEEEDYERCPSCNRHDCLMDVDKNVTFFDKSQIEDLWHLLEDVPMNPETEEMEEEFFGFPIGTHREEIWHWFDERYGGGVHALMGV